VRSGGEELLAAGQVALEEVNEYLNATGAGWQLELVVEDSELKPDVALQKLQALYAQGIRIVTGIGFSADLKAMMTYANTNHILLLAGGNSHELAVPGLRISGSSHRHYYGKMHSGSLTRTRDQIFHLCLERRCIW
jgi:ABC-type branched-subunit amino acid transport system substrate-binding protein